jgi:predicted AlkP superfamily pyrophosphatase or phosphodiesterase
MLPSAPKTLGRLSDVFISALGSITGKSNRLGLAKASRVCVVLVDGLGSENLRRAAGHAPFLNSALKTNKSISTVFPSTTAAAITSFGIGVSPSSHGVYGYSVYDRALGVVRNLLSGWSPDFEPEQFQRLASVFSSANKSNVTTYSVGPGEYSDSGFTRLNMTPSVYLPAKSFEDRIREARRILQSKTKSLTYLYFPELDSTAHAFGVESEQWLAKVEELDQAIKSLVSDLPNDCGVVLTADHGIVDVPRENQILLDELPIENLLAVTGDPRCTFLYFEHGANVGASKSLLSQTFGGRVQVCTVTDLKNAGWLAKQIVNDDFLPDLVLISNSSNAVYHRAFAKPQSLRMVGQHGGISQAELSVPLLKFGVFAD